MFKTNQYSNECVSIWFKCAQKLVAYKYFIIGKYQILYYYKITTYIVNTIKYALYTYLRMVEKLFKYHH